MTLLPSWGAAAQFVEQVQQKCKVRGTLVAVRIRSDCCNADLPGRATEASAVCLLQEYRGAIEAQYAHVFSNMSAVLAPAGSPYLVLSPFARPFNPTVVCGEAAAD